MAGSRDLDELAQRRTIARVKAGVEDDLLKRPGVTAVDVDYKLVGGRRTKTLSITIWVEEKKDVPKGDSLPASIKGIPTDVVEGTFDFGTRKASTPVSFGTVSSQSECSRPINSEREGTETAVRPSDPLLGGISIGSCDRDDTGTLGVTFVQNGVHKILSNYHVLAGSDSQPRDPVVQPGQADGGACPDNIAGYNLIGRFGQPYNVDAAVAEVEYRFSKPGEILAIGQLTGTDVTFPGDFVGKYGRTTQFTTGTVVSDTFTFQATHPVFGPATFYNQIRVRILNPGQPFFSPGDSGSILVNEDREAVGLLLGSFTSDGTEVDGVANPIQDVIRELGLEDSRPL